MITVKPDYDSISVTTSLVTTQCQVTSEFDFDRERVKKGYI